MDDKITIGWLPSTVTDFSFITNLDFLVSLLCMNQSVESDETTDNHNEKEYLIRNRR